MVWERCGADGSGNVPGIVRMRSPGDTEPGGVKPGNTEPGVGEPEDTGAGGAGQDYRGKTEDGEAHKGWWLLYSSTGRGQAPMAV